MKMVICKVMTTEIKMVYCKLDILIKMVSCKVTTIENQHGYQGNRGLGGMVAGVLWAIRGVEGVRGALEG